ncbi:7-deoxyloganetin glucosyltransferase-like protein [Tanacetum coccineum]
MARLSRCYNSVKFFFSSERNCVRFMASQHEKKRHAVCIPAPLQGHINPMLKLAKILHSKGFDITFVNTEFNHQRLLRSQGSETLNGLPSFRFETIPDGLPPPENKDASQDIPSLAKSTDETCSGPFKTNIHPFFYRSKLFGERLFGYNYRWYTRHEWYTLKDIPPFIRMIYPGDEYMAHFFSLQVNRAKTASAIIFNTFNGLEPDVLDTHSSMFPPCYGIGPLHLLEKSREDNSLASIKSNLWKEESECLTWLDSQAPASVIYVNFGSIAVMTNQQLVEFCWGLANSNYPFLWIIKPDLVVGDSAMLPPEFVTRTSGRGLLVRWRPQEQVLNHPSIGGFLTHFRWNSTLESISSGMPMICWPFFADQQVNCWLSCNKWDVAMEIDNDVKRDEMGKLVVELMNGEKGNTLRKNATKWKKKAEAACVTNDGSSVANLEKLVHHLQTSSNK